MRLPSASALVSALLFLLWSCTADDTRNASSALFGQSTLPGWLKNIDNALVRVAFPAAQRVYVELHPEIKGLWKGGPVVSQLNTSINVPPVAVPKTEAAPDTDVEAGPGAVRKLLC